MQNATAFEAAVAHLKDGRVGKVSSTQADGMIFNSDEQGQFDPWIVGT